MGQRTPTRGPSLPGQTCDTLHVLTIGAPCRAHARISLAGARVWEDSTGTEIGSWWQLTYKDPPVGTYDLFHWYSVNDAPPGCPHQQTLVVKAPYTVDPLWTMTGAIFDSRGKIMNVYDICRMLTRADSILVRHP